jgi:polyhydroxyalkanoate synthesis regulator phasin
LGEEPNSPKEIIMLDMVKKAMLTGVGFAVKNWDEVEKMAKDMAKKSRMSEKEGQKFLDDVRKKYDEAQEKLESRAEKIVKDLLKRGNIATSDDIRALKKEISDLKKKIRGEGSDK